jgi:hypothetical protein
LPRWPVLYLPSPTGPTQDFPGYPLDRNTDLAAQKQDIIAAMSGHTFLSIQVADIQRGVVLLNGAALDFAVLARFTADPPGAAGGGSAGAPVA